MMECTIINMETLRKRDDLYTRVTNKGAPTRWFVKAETIRIGETYYTRKQLREMRIHELDVFEDILYLYSMVKDQCLIK